MSLFHATGPSHVGFDPFSHARGLAFSLEQMASLPAWSTPHATSVAVPPLLRQPFALPTLCDAPEVPFAPSATWSRARLSIFNAPALVHLPPPPPLRSLSPLRQTESAPFACPGGGIAIEPVKLSWLARLWQAIKRTFAAVFAR